MTKDDHDVVQVFLFCIGLPLSAIWFFSAASYDAVQFGVSRMLLYYALSVVSISTTALFVATNQYFSQRGQTVEALLGCLVASTKVSQFGVSATYKQRFVHA
jgi:hypothetical protein